MPSLLALFWAWFAVDAWSQEGTAESSAITTHLLEVVDTLGRETPADLAPETRARRLALLARLEAYARDGRFPQHRSPSTVRDRRVAAPRTFPDPDRSRMPLFVDDAGVHCAVGWLMAADAPDLVAAIRAHENDAFLPEMHTAGITDWAAHAGFTADELAWIQPSYTVLLRPCEGEPIPAESPEGEPAESPAGADLAVEALYGGPCRNCDESLYVSVRVSSLGAKDVEAYDLHFSGVNNEVVTPIASWRLEGLAAGEVVDVGPFDLGQVGLETSVTVTLGLPGDADPDNNEAWVASSEPMADVELSKECRREAGGCDTSGAGAGVFGVLLGALALRRRYRG